MKASIMRLYKKLNLLSYVYVEKLSHLKFGFKQIYILVHFTMLGPTCKNFLVGNAKKLLNLY
jgi:hypothetical protein